MVSVASLIEIMTLSDKGRIKYDFYVMQDKIKNHRNYEVIDLDPQIISAAEPIKNIELFDRLILGTAMHLGIPVLTSDQEMHKYSEVETIWG